MDLSYNAFIYRPYYYYYHDKPYYESAYISKPIELPSSRLIEGFNYLNYNISLIFILTLIIIFILYRNSLKNK